jgi:hypothetical protein
MLAIKKMMLLSNSKKPQPKPRKIEMTENEKPMPPGKFTKKASK